MSAQDEEDVEEEEIAPVVPVPRAQAASSAAGNESSRNNKKRSKRLDILPGPNGSAIIRCKCDELVLVHQFNAHVQTNHTTTGRRPLICGAGCGTFIVNRPLSDLEIHKRSGECARRVAEIRRVMAADGGMGV